MDLTILEMVQEALKTAEQGNLEGTRSQLAAIEAHILAIGDDQYAEFCANQTN